MKPTITVVSLGPGDHRLLTVQSLEALKSSRRLILRTAKHRPQRADRQYRKRRHRHPRHYYARHR